VKAFVEEFVSRNWAVPREGLSLVLHPVRGGLESPVARVTIAGAAHPAVPERMIVKQLSAGGRREADVYRLLWTHVNLPPTARVLGVQSVGDTRYLYLEDVRAGSSWPWSDTRSAAAVCRELARFHDGTTLPRAAFAWNYDEELRRSADATLAVALHARDETGRRVWRRLGDLRRVVSSVGVIRSRLASSGRAVIHGDVHPGNVLLRDAPRGPQVALIDWGRARLGSPLEDVASWLHSLGCWEPQARRRHDTLLRAYLGSRREPQPLDAQLREHYWYASVSNGLAGAIRYHLAVLGDREDAARLGGDSRRALIAWERVVRRAAALLSTSANRCTGRG
jgi:Ser/Thr protein kinase RdoA (MazF antagonist)